MIRRLTADNYDYIQSTFKIYTMKTNSIVVISISILVSLTMFTSCQKEELVTLETEGINNDVSKARRSLIPLFPGHDDRFFGEVPIQPNEQSNGEVIVQNVVNEDGTLSRCTIEPISSERSVENFPPLGDNLINEKLFPGALVTGVSVMNPLLTVPNTISMPRAGGIISILGITGGFNEDSNGNSIFEPLSEVTQPRVAAAMNKIINRKQEQNLPSNFTFEFSQIESKDQLAFSLGVSAKAFGARLNASLAFSTDKVYNRVLVKLEQSYYTMKIQEPNSRQEIFPDTVTDQDIRDHFSINNPPAYISSVDYGRVFYMLIESTQTRQEIEAAVKASLNRAVFSGSVESDVKKVAELSDLSVKVYAFGGDASGTLSLSGETDLRKIVTTLAEATDIRNGVPISYTVRSLFNPSKIIRKGLSANFDKVNCVAIGAIPAGYRNLVGLFGTDRNTGGIGAIVQMRGSTLLLYNRAGTKYALYNVARGKVLNNKIYTHNDPNGPLGVSPLANVGAAFLSRHRNENNKIRLFDISGLTTVRMDFNKKAFNCANCSPDTGIPTNLKVSYPQQTLTATANFFNRNFVGPYPFSSEGVSAAFFTSVRGHYPNDTYSFTAFNGTKVAKTKGRKNDDPVWLTTSPTTINANFPLTSIGAAGTVAIGGQRERIVINAEGTKMAIRKKNGNLGPFIIN